MNTFVVAFFAALAITNAHVIPAVGVISHDIIAPINTGTTLQGPSTRTVVAGPDGSKIIAEAPGGVVATNTQHAAVVKTAVVAEAVPVVHQAVAVAPALPAVVAHEESVIVDNAPVIANTVVAEQLLHAAPVVAKVEHIAVAPATAVVGTKTSIVSTSLDQVHPSPSVVAHAAPAVVSTHVAPAVTFEAKAVPTLAVHAAPGLIAHAAPGLIAHAAPVAIAHAAPALVATKTFVAHSAPVVADHAAPLLAHGPIAYHGVVAHAPAVYAARAAYVASPLTASGYPLLAPGSGIEGQYVADNIEQLYDDGTYKGEFFPHH